MKNPRFYCLILLFLGSGVANLSGQPSGMEWLTAKQGLSQGFVLSLLQDQEGFIWLGTKNGLNRYDGYRFEVFTKDPYDEFSLSSDFILRLVEFGDFILIGTETGGINILHKKTRRIYRLHVEMPYQATPLDQCGVNWLSVDEEGNIWAQVYIFGQPKPNTRLYKFTLPAEFWKNPPPNNDWQKNITFKSWDKGVFMPPYMLPDKKGVFVSTEEGVFLINTQTEHWDPIVSSISPEQELLGCFFHADHFGRYWIVLGYWLNNNIYTDFYLHHTDPKDKRILPSKVVQMDPKISFAHISKDYVWFNYGGSEIRACRLDENGAFDLNRPDIEGIKVPHGTCNIITDRSGVVWLCTNGIGVLKINLKSRSFRNYFKGESIYSPMIKDGHGNILAHNNFGRLLYQPGAVPFPNSNIEDLRRIKEETIEHDGKGSVWLVARHYLSFDWYLKKIDPQGNIRTFPMPWNQFQKISLALDAKGNPWLASMAGLMRFDPATEQFVEYPFRANSAAGNDIMAMDQTPDGSWWLGTRNGLIRTRVQDENNPNTIDIQWFKNDLATRNSLSNNQITSLLADPNDPDILWIGTNGGGLDRFDVRNLKFSHLSTREGLPDNVIYGVLAEAAPKAPGTVLWMSSNKGLIRYTPSTGNIKNYTEEDGVQGNEFNTWAFSKGLNGELFFGGVNGMTAFYPNELQEDTLPPRTLITRLKLNEQDVSWKDSTGVLTQGIEFTREIEIPFSRNNISLEFVAIHFASTSKNRFRYYLEGAEAEWLHESSEHSASYLNLAPGTYVFRVKSANSEGVWSTEAATLKITILPPWYRSWLAWLAYILILGGSAYAFYRYQLRTQLQVAENQRLKEQDSFKSRFFTNITHEFRTPLTVILGMTERLSTEGGRWMDEGAKRHLTLIKNSGENLLRLINQLLDLAKLESNTVKINYIQGDILPFLRYITESLHSLANAQNVLLRVESDQTQIVMDYDSERLLQIVHNLLSNAIKFTPSGGKVTLRSSVQSGKLHLEVADTGVGIPAEDVPFLFDRFFQAKNLEKAKAGGTGIGLSLTKELVGLLGGTITVSSEVDKGTVFQVQLPISNLAEKSTQTFKAIEWSEKNAPPLPASSASIKVNTTGPTLLLIEDNPDVVEYLSACLQDSYQLEFAYNGRVGIEKALESIPDLIISDVMMPEKDGYEVCKTLKNDERSSHIPIVLLTAKAGFENRIDGLRQGADAYLAKPFHREELLLTLQNMMGLRQNLQAYLASRDGATSAAQPQASAFAIEDSFVQKVRAAVEARLDDSGFNVDDLCRALAMSQPQLHRKLTALTGKNATLFIRSVRLSKAKMLLLEKTQTVSEVAYAVGFEDPKYFSRVFAEEFGVPPSKF